jgi:hypothetical protein
MKMQPLGLLLLFLVAANAANEAITSPPPVSPSGPPTRKPRVKVKIVETPHAASNQGATTSPPQYGRAGYQYQQQQPTVPPVPLAAPAPAQLLNAFRDWPLSVVNASTQDNLHHYHLSLFDSITFDYMSPLAATNGTIGVFKHWDRDQFQAQYWLARQDCLITAVVQLQCSGSIEFAFKKVEGCSHVFSLKCPQACSFRLSITEALQTDMSSKLLRASALLASKVTEFEEKVQAMHSEISEYRKCVDFAAGRISETKLDVCIDLIGRDLPSSAPPATPPTTQPLAQNDVHHESSHENNEIDSEADLHAGSIED